MNGKYPINREDADELAILQTKIMSLSGQDSTSDSPNYEFFAWEIFETHNYLVYVILI